MVGLTKGRLGDPVPGLLRGHDMQEVVLALHLLGALSQVLEGGDAGLVVYGYKVVLEEALDVALLADGIQSLGVLGHGEHG